MRLHAQSVRFRTTATATLVVGIALLVASVALVTLLQRSLTDDVRTAAELRAADVAQVLRSGAPANDLMVDDEEEVLIQVVDRAGAVIAASRNVAGEPPITDLAPGESARVPTTPIEDDEFLVVAQAAATPDGDVVVLVGRTLETVDEARGTVISLLAGGVPLVLAVVALTTWRLVGRALAPIDAMRAQADEVSANALHRRVPVPHTHDEVERLAVTLNAMLDRLERAQQRQQRFVSDASHELRSPVASIRHHAEIAATHPESVTTSDLAAVVLDEDRRLERLVDQMLVLAQADERVVLREHRPVDLDDLVFEEAGRARADGSRGIDVSGVSAGRVSGDRGQLRRVVRNLIDNATRHAASTVSIALFEENGSVVLRVEDDGTGIPEAERRRVFERFVRLDGARSRDDGGAGLGLAIVAVIVDAHGGSVAASSSSLGGARLEVRLPRSDA